MSEQSIKAYEALKAQLRTTTGEQLKLLSDTDLRLYADGVVEMLAAIKAEFDRRMLERSPAVGRA